MHARRASGAKEVAAPVGVRMSTTATRAPGRVAAVAARQAFGQLVMTESE